MLLSEHGPTKASRHFSSRFKQPAVPESMHAPQYLRNKRENEVSPETTSFPTKVRGRSFLFGDTLDDQVEDYVPALRPTARE